MTTLDTPTLDTPLLESPLRIKHLTLKNRLAKGAMSETLAPDSGRFTPELLKLYETWAQGGLGLCISGNVMVDWRAKNEPGVIVIENETDLPALSQWAAQGKRYGMAQIIQLSHPGKQCPKGLNTETVAPSAIGFGATLSKFFGTPRALSVDEIWGIIRRFGESARICHKAGFEGIQLHGAHGYLISQFLSPLHNQRTDEWGGSLDNRMRFVLECYKEVRRQTSDAFLVGIKLNSADFQKGGYDEADAAHVFKALDQLGIDFIEISGGTYEAPAMTGTKKSSTRVREAYFLEFAQNIRSQVSTALMVTGGFRSHNAMAQALSSNACDLIGIARPLAVEPNAPQRLLAGHNVQHAIAPIKVGIKAIDNASIMEIIWYAAHFRAMGQGRTPNPRLSPYKVLGKYMLNNVKATIQGRFRFRA